MEIATRTLEDIHCLDLKGRLDLAGAEVAEKAFHEVLQRKIQEGKAPSLLVDFKEVSYISSGGLRSLVQAFKQVQAAGGKMALVDMNVAVQEVFEFAGLDTVFSIFATPSEGVEALRK